ncbi:hypothetical protein D041_4152B, partial [Vibrio parahaemolyticus EKP-008]
VVYHRPFVDSVLKFSQLRWIVRVGF